MSEVIVNSEQLEAEMQAGLSVPVPLALSRSTLAHLVFAAQHALQSPLSLASVEIFREFIVDAQRIGGFEPETSKLIYVKP